MTHSLLCAQGLEAVQSRSTGRRSGATIETEAFLPHDASMRAISAVSGVVNLSVRLSVALVVCDTAKESANILIAYDSAITLSLVVGGLG